MAEPDPDPPTVVKLTPRLEAEVAKLAKVLEDTPPEWLLDAFSSPAPKSTMPMRWHD